MTDSDRFGRSYWSADSQYRKFADYEAALAALRDWHQGFFRLIAGDLPPAGRALDAGCGHGAIVHELLARGWDAYGFDLSAWMIDQARAANPPTAERFAVGELASVPFEGTFDLVTCLEVVEHVPDPIPALSSLATRLRPGGRLIATTPNLRPRFPWWWDAESIDPTHVSVHEPHWWWTAFTQAGLHVRSTQTFLALPLLWRLHPLLARWIRLGRQTGPGILIVADRAT